MRSLLEEQGLVVVGEASGGEQAVRLARELSPDVTVMDLGARTFKDLTDFPGIDSWPMWSQDGFIYFVSDRDPDSQALHHCAICGATELSDPNLEFRVATNGEEYCLPHLGRAKVTPA